MFKSLTLALINGNLRKPSACSSDMNEGHLSNFESADDRVSDDYPSSAIAYPYMPPPLYTDDLDGRDYDQPNQRQSLKRTSFNNKRRISSNFTTSAARNSSSATTTSISSSASSSKNGKVIVHHAEMPPTDVARPLRRQSTTTSSSGDENDVEGLTMITVDDGRGGVRTTHVSRPPDAQTEDGGTFQVLHRLSNNNNNNSATNNTTDRGQRQRSWYLMFNSTKDRPRSSDDVESTSTPDAGGAKNTRNPLLRSPIIMSSNNDDGEKKEDDAGGGGGLPINYGLEDMLQREFHGRKMLGDIDVADDERLRRRILSKRGVVHIGMSHMDQTERTRYLFDFFNTMLDLQWRYVLIIFCMSFFLSWLFFATIWYAIVYNHGDLAPENLPHKQQFTGWKPCVYAIHNFVSCFLFSVETQHTIGYGTRQTSEECPEAVIVMSFQSVVGVMIQACMVGTIFAKISRPKKRAETLMFSKNAVVCMRDNYLCLCFRFANMRLSRIADCRIRAVLVSKKMTEEGETIPYYQTELKVGTDTNGSVNNIFFAWPLTITHRIDQTSPFYNMSATDFLRKRYELFVLLEGIVETTGMSIQARSSYLPTEIVWGYRFCNDLHYHQRLGEYRVNYSMFNSVVKVETPEFSARTLNDKRRQAALLAQSCAPAYAGQDSRVALQNAGSLGVATRPGSTVISPPQKSTLVAASITHARLPTPCRGRGDAVRMSKTHNHSGDSLSSVGNKILSASISKWKSAMLSPSHSFDRMSIRRAKKNLPPSSSKSEAHENSSAVNTNKSCKTATDDICFDETCTTAAWHNAERSGANFGVELTQNEIERPTVLHLGPSVADDPHPANQGLFTPSPLAPHFAGSQNSDQQWLAAKETNTTNTTTTPDQSCHHLPSPVDDESGDKCYDDDNILML